jgi:hypothetical protein
MSYYSVYSFYAVTHPLTASQQKEARQSSSRATITARKFHNVYHYGHFRGSVDELMEKFYDVHLSYDSHGNLDFALAFRDGLVPEALLQQYHSDHLTLRRFDGGVILSLCMEEHSLCHEGEEEGAHDTWGERLWPIHEELTRGDLRGLYLIWLASLVWLYEEEERLTELPEDAIEPPIPPGLNALTATQEALAAFLHLDKAALEIAAHGDPSAALKNPMEGQRLWLCALPVEEKEQLLWRVAQGEGAAVAQELAARYHETDAYKSACQIAGANTQGRRPVVDLLRQIITHREVLDHKEREAEARERARQREAGQRVRNAYLKKNINNTDSLWDKVNNYMMGRDSRKYTNVVDTLLDLRDIYHLRGQERHFTTKLAALVNEHQKKRPFLDQLRQRGLHP